MTKLEYAKRNQAKIMRYPINSDLKPFKNWWVLFIVVLVVFLLSFLN